MSNLCPAARMLGVWRAARCSQAGASSSRLLSRYTPSASYPPRQYSDEVGTLDGAKVRIAPLRRSGEDDGTLRARLLYQSRKRGILESDLLLSTFADTYLPGMPRQQLETYDKFLDENDWDIYYWATQEPQKDGELEPTSAEATSGITGGKPSARARPEGEWADAVGAFKPAYRPVPARWKESEILTLLREHVKTKKAGGMAFMPSLK